MHIYHSTNSLLSPVLINLQVITERNGSREPICSFLNQPRGRLIYYHEGRTLSASSSVSTVASGTGFPYSLSRRLFSRR